MYFRTMAFQIQTIVVGPFEVNCYVPWDNQSGDAVIIDPGADEQLIIETISKLGCTPKAILLTHGHGDHIAAVSAIKKAYNIPLYVGEGEEHLLLNPSANLSAFYGLPVIAPEADAIVQDEDLVTFGSLSFTALLTPGHSPGGICYLYERDGVLFCGDALFQGSIGRTDFPGSSHDQLVSSIQRKIMTLPDAVVCYPGHGPRTTVGAERRSNPFLTGEHFA